MILPSYQRTLFSFCPAMKEKVLSDFCKVLNFPRGIKKAISRKPKLPVKRKINKSFNEFSTRAQI
jgi:hypothetical protein